MLAVVNWKKAYKELRTKFYQVEADKKVLGKTVKDQSRIIKDQSRIIKDQSRIITELQAENGILKSNAEGQDGTRPNYRVS